MRDSKLRLLDLDAGTEILEDETQHSSRTRSRIVDICVGWSTEVDASLSYESLSPVT